jgi:Ca2+-binding RTX toxin-like protein
MTTFTIGGGGGFATITAALASGLVVPGDTLVLLPGYSTETATVGIENLTFSGDASNTGIALTLGAGIMAVALTGTAPIAVTGNGSNNSITGNDGSNALTGSQCNDSINGGAGDDTIYYETGTGGSPPVGAIPGWDPYHLYYWHPGDGIDTIDGGPDHDTLIITGNPVLYDDDGKGYGGSSSLKAVVVDGAITSIANSTVANVETVMLDLGEEYDALDYAGTIEAVTVNLATGTATGFSSIAGVDDVFGGSGDDTLTSDAGGALLLGRAGLDTLTGGDGYDALYGGDGADSLEGGAGNDSINGGDMDGVGDGDQDILTGGLGADRFGFVRAADSVVGAPDVITDWESADNLSLGEIDANTSVDGNQDFTFLGLGAADLTVGQGQLKYYQSGGNTYVVGNVTADNEADFQIQINGLHVPNRSKALRHPRWTTRRTTSRWLAAGRSRPTNLSPTARSSAPLSARIRTARFSLIHWSIMPTDASRSSPVPAR